jgi:hypothetical protein
MGSGLGSAGNPEQAAAGQGRHRRDEKAPAWPARESTKALARKRSGVRRALNRHSRPEVGPTAETGPSANSSAAVGGVPTVRATGRSSGGAHAGNAQDGAQQNGTEQNGTVLKRRTRTAGGEPVDMDEAAGDGEGDGDPLDTGLGMFNLGTIPASVTPPRSWRRAAWFTVVASVAALAGLLAIGAVLMCPHEARRLTAMPYFPDGSPLAAIGDTTGVPRPTGRGHQPATTQAATDVVADVGDTSPLTTARRAVGTAPARTTGLPPASNPVVATLPPVDTIVTGNGDPVVDPVKLIKRTQTFFAEVTSNAKAAAGLAVDTAKDDVAAVIEQKYRNLSSISVRSISLDPNSGLTVSVVRVVGKDGTTSTQRVTLQFTLTGDPKIVNFGK